MSTGPFSVNAIAYRRLKCRIRSYNSLQQTRDSLAATWCRPRMARDCRCALASCDASHYDSLPADSCIGERNRRTAAGARHTNGADLSMVLAKFPATFCSFADINVLGCCCCASFNCCCCYCCCCCYFYTCRDCCNTPVATAADSPLDVTTGAPFHAD